MIDGNQWFSGALYAPIPGAFCPRYQRLGGVDGGKERTMGQTPVLNVAIP